MRSVRAANAARMFLTREYYNSRIGNTPEVRLGRDRFIPMLAGKLRAYRETGWLQEAFGYHCVDAGTVAGTIGTSFEAHLLLEAAIDVKSPFDEHIGDLSDPELFTLLEVFVDAASEPLNPQYHHWHNCGYHCHNFDSSSGRKKVISELSKLLRLYSSGYLISPSGEIELLMNDDTVAILDEKLPPSSSQDVHQRVNSAVVRFRRGSASWEERHAAVRDLGDALESLRPQVKAVLTHKDESDLFNILNGFGIRHLNDKQQTAYDREVFLKWIFYYLLASVHASLEIINKRVAGE